jgi:hypothetical protein
LRGEVPRCGVELMNRFQSVLFAIEPATEGQKLLHGTMPLELATSAV